MPPKSLKKKLLPNNIHNIFADLIARFRRDNVEKEASITECGGEESGK